MEEKKTVFDYISQVFCMFGISMLLLNIFCRLFGASAKEISAMFALGDAGLPVDIMLQFFVISVCITGFRFLFFTDTLIKQMSLAARTIGMVASILVVMAVFIIWFDWFPTDMWQSWAMFFLCFGICFAVSTAAMVIREKSENKRMEQALNRFKEEEL